jgi:hypothetical protein
MLTIREQKKTGLNQLAGLLLLLLLPLSLHWTLWQRDFPGVHYEPTSLVVYLSDVAVLLLVGVTWLYPRPDVGSARRLTKPLLALTILASLSSLWALDSGLALLLAGRLWLLWLLLGAWGRLRPLPITMQIGAGLSLGLQAVVALLQFGRQSDLGLRWLGELSLNPYPGGASILTVGDSYWLRGYGLTPHPNILGGILVAFLFVVLAAYLSSSGWARWGWLALLAVGAAGLLVSFSRSAWLGGLVGGIFFLLLLLGRAQWRAQYGRSLLPLLLITGLLLGGFIISQHHLLLSRASPDETISEQRSLSERQALAQIARHFFSQQPLTGIGANNFAVAAIPLAAPLAGVAPQPDHHLPRLLAAELGTLGGILWLWLMVWPVGAALLAWWHGRLSLWTLALTAALLALAIVDCFDYYSWGWPQGRLLRWTLWALWLMNRNTQIPVRRET